MIEDEPNLVHSRLSRRVIWSGHRLVVEIYRIENEPSWTLEVVNEAGTSTVWDEPFRTDHDAYAAFTDTLAGEGIAAFVDNANVIPFPRPR